MSEGQFANRVPAGVFGQNLTHSRQERASQSGGTLYTQGPVQQNSQADSTLASMINSFTHTHLGVPGSTLQGTPNAGAGQFSLNAGQYFYTSDGQLVYAAAPGVYAPQAIATTQLADSNYGTYPGALQYLQPASYSGYMPGYPVIPYTPGRSGYWADRADALHKDVPGLENRRGSYSTTESTPGTPYYGSLGSREHGTHIAAIDRSPIYSTPSPQQISHAALVHQVAKGLPYKTISIHADMEALLQQPPTIPHAVPAVFTPHERMRTLDQSLSNPILGNRNVYIRGLHPNTDDETLAAYAARFGKVETSKAIIDTSTGACKGFGFAKYHDVRESEMCIRGFYKLGYEVGFARESFNSRLKAEGDESSTNLYVSNLPKSMTEAELGAIFIDYTVSSSRILRDPINHQSRGVGFARFENRDICDEIIKKFHGQPIGDEGLLLQVRYADTPAQKDLKRVTTERRQFRTTEYNVGAYGSPADIIALSPALSPVVPARMAQIARHLPHSGQWKRESSISAFNGRSNSVTFKDVDRSATKHAHKYGSSTDVELK
ncbi:MAG: hypothetical protein M1818_006162 [Claussenomyces sp. TS43310]|nr:MAG: hypothetical protein M1818_006162 [Claussenomyces sp. TS43310]